MDRETTQPVVLARIPDVATSANHHEGAKQVPSSTGRVIGQSASFKLLAGVVLLLIVAAVIPYALWKHGQSAAPAPSATAEVPPAWHPGTPAASASAAPTWTPVATMPASGPIPASPSPMPSAAPQPMVASTPPAPAPIDSALMSAWPNSTHPVAQESGAEEPRASANQAMAVRSPEYIRNNGYDGTRSSVH
jgi:hypothetical protein